MSHIKKKTNTRIIEKKDFLNKATRDQLYDLLFALTFLWLGVKKVVCLHKPDRPYFCADPKLVLVFVDGFRAKILFSVREMFFSTLLCVSSMSYL